MGGQTPRTVEDSVSDAGDSRSDSAPHKFRRWLLVAALAVGLIGLISGLFWFRFTTTPQYSYRQLSGSARRGDWVGVQRYLDAESVASSYVDALLSNAASGSADAAARPSTMGGRAGGSKAPGAASGSEMKISFAKRFEASLKQSVEDSALKDRGGISSVLIAGRPGRVTFVSEDVATVAVEVPEGDDADPDAQLTMQRVDDHWRVMAVSNIDDLLGSLN